MVLLIDISRLVENLHYKAPTGIDRVEFAYAKHFLDRAKEIDVRFLVTWLNFNGILTSDQTRPIVEDVSTRWLDQSGDIANDQDFAGLQNILASPIVAGQKRVPNVGGPDRPSDIAAIVGKASIWIRSAASRISRRLIDEFRHKGVSYIHVSQFRLNRPRRFDWLSAASARSLFLLHDLIPITHPEYCRPGEAQRHRARVETMAKHASVIVTNSEYTRKSLANYFESTGRTSPQCETVPLGVDSIFRNQQASSSFMAPPIPYFVVVGTIEPRKNLEFLLHVWRDWVSKRDACWARLLIIGRRGWENENIVNMLERSASLAPSVVEVTSLSDSGLVALLRNARALLAPSLVEGFGLPVAEALTLRVPVIASDIEAFREVGGDFVEYINPLDGQGWMAALEDYVKSDSRRRQHRLALLQSYKPVPWSAHMTKIEQILARSDSSA